VKDPALAQLGPQIRNLRLQKSLTIDDLAIRANLTLDYLRKLEQGRVNPGLSAFTRVAKALEVHPGALLGYVPQPLSPKALDFGKAFDAAPDAIQQPILKILHAVRAAQQSL
jgi:transcriptional regulator with XRE-family HTH domain